MKRHTFALILAACTTLLHGCQSKKEKAFQSSEGVREVVNRLTDAFGKTAYYTDITLSYVKEVHYEVDGNKYYAIGFQNSSGGYALRNKYVKQASMPNDYTFINNGAKEVALFEGFFDFLSYKQMLHGQQEPKRNYLILNSTSFFEKSLPILQEHDRVFGYGQNDKPGTIITAKAEKVLKEKFSDERGLYKGYKDLNEWLMNMGINQKQGIRHHL